ncbi:MAG: adenosylmethionine--8-amino-7-oxononanoate transaminase [Nitrosopumilus sp. D6]|nr:MAG: adenosylmethionine--8-amino-7-oxononanoate transaminase [Nitrosopumilus sp. D6]
MEGGASNSCLKKSRIWHPNTQMAEWKKFCTIRSARGVWLTDTNGNKMIDAVASMWCNVWGHSERRLVTAMTSQAKKLQHSSLFNLTNRPAEELADRLVGISPGMNSVFFSDNGSSAMEVAVKMAIQYCKNTNQKRTKIAALKNGYHGDTFGAMSVGYIPEFFSRFQRQLFPVVRLSVPDKYRPPRGMTPQDHTEYCLDKMEERLGRGDIAALVMESGAQVAGGALLYPEGFERSAGRICKRHGVLLVLDEIATGFGRLGPMIQYARQKCSPDIVAYGKMLTGGYLTMAATLATKKVYDAFLGEFDEHLHLFHGHTYTGNPIAAAVANTNLRMYKERNLINRIKKTSLVFEQFYDELLALNMVGDVRHRGMLMGIELVSDKRKKTPVTMEKSINSIIFEEGRKNGIYLRTLGNIVLLVPPLAITEEELEMLLNRTVRTIKTLKTRIM